MIYTANSLLSKWDNMLSGNLDWIEDFKKSRWYYVFERPFQECSSFDMNYKRAFDEMKSIKKI